MKRERETCKKRRQNIYIWSANLRYYFQLICCACISSNGFVNILILFDFCVDFEGGLNNTRGSMLYLLNEFAPCVDHLLCFEIYNFRLGNQIEFLCYT
jgi:hypothetical protein